MQGKLRIPRLGVSVVDTFCYVHLLCYIDIVYHGLINNIYQLIVHIHSGYESVRDEKFIRADKPGHEGEFKSDRLWKAAYHIIQNKMNGHERLDKIVQLSNKKASASVADINGVKSYCRDDDMELRIVGVLALISSMAPLSLFDDSMMKEYLYSLNPQHRPPHRLERIRITEVVMDLMAQEFSDILEERREELSESFLCGTTDMWTDSHRKEQFGALVINIIANKYRLNNGKELFMSKKTAKSLQNDGRLSSVSIVFVMLCAYVLYHFISYSFIFASSSHTPNS